MVRTSPLGTLARRTQRSISLLPVRLNGDHHYQHGAIRNVGSTGGRLGS
jgi:hypothetical protein